MSDLIDRQAALDALANLSVGNVPNTEDYLFVLKGIVAASDCIESLPVVQPDHNADVSKKVSISCAQENDVRRP